MLLGNTEVELVNSSWLAISWLRYGAWLLPTMLAYGSFSSTITTSLPVWAVAVGLLVASAAFGCAKLMVVDTNPSATAPKTHLRRRGRDGTASSEGQTALMSSPR